VDGNKVNNLSGTRNNDDDGIGTEKNEQANNASTPHGNNQQTVEEATLKQENEQGSIKTYISATRLTGEIADMIIANTVEWMESGES
jgi:hypothetical protein